MDNDSATAQPAQDVTTRIEAALYPEEATITDEPVVTEDEEVLEDAPLEEELPEDDDSDSDEDEGSDEDVSDEDATLAAYLGIDEDRLIVGDDGTVSFNAIIDGETKAVPLKDLAASYQLQGHVNNKSMALETERKDFEGVKTKVFDELKQRVEGVASLASLLEQELIGDYQKVDWEALRHSDPTEWVALRQEFADKASKIQKSKDLAGEEAARLAEQQKEEFNKNTSEMISYERSKMLEKNPEWADADKRKEALGNFKSFLTSTYGYTPEDAERISDHRLIEVVKDAMAYRKGKKTAETKKVKTLPKFQKPGAARTNSASLAKARAVKAKKAAVKKSGGSVQSVANALLDRM